MFGIDMIDAGLLPAMLVALLAGVLSFLSALRAADRAALSGLYGRHSAWAR